MVSVDIETSRRQSTGRVAKRSREACTRGGVAFGVGGGQLEDLALHGAQREPDGLRVDSCAHARAAGSYPGGPPGEACRGPPEALGPQRGRASGERAREKSHVPYRDPGFGAVWLKTRLVYGGPDP
jgi:hypothetical protein